MLIPFFIYSANWSTDMMNFENGAKCYVFQRNKLEGNRVYIYLR